MKLEDRRIHGWLMDLYDRRVQGANVRMVQGGLVELGGLWSLGAIGYKMVWWSLSTG